jgi:hypothetical protein
LVADRHNLNKLVDNETRKEYQIDVANRFSALESLDISSVDDTWVKIRDSIKASAKEKVGVLETNRNKPWFDRNVQN